MIKIYNSTLPQTAQIVNSIGKYLYKNLSGAINFKKSSNMFDVWTIVLYQIPQEIAKKYNLSIEESQQVNEMLLDINLTGYNTKIRVNIIEESPDEMTIGSQTFDLEKYKTRYTNQQACFTAIKDSIEAYIIRRLKHRYEDYEFLY